MSPRINISYSIEMSQLAPEVERLLKEAEKQLKKVQISFPEIVEANLDLQQYDKIDEMRHQLANIDHCLSDVNSIINSYNVYRVESLNSLDASEVEHLTNVKKNLDRLQTLIPPGTNEVAD